MEGNKLQGKATRQGNIARQQGKDCIFHHAVYESDKDHQSVPFFAQCQWDIRDRS